MLASLRSRLSYANVMATIACFSALAGGTYAVAGITAGTGTIKGCYAKKGKASGQLRVIDRRKRCRSSERTVTWRQRGQAGRAGRAGSTGSTGAMGARGAEGARGATGLVDTSNTSFVQGGGRLSSNRVQVADDANGQVIVVPGFGGIEASCSGSGIEMAFRSSELGLELFTDGSEGPSIATPRFRTLGLGQGGLISTDVSAGDSETVTLQMATGGGAGARLATVIVSAHLPSPQGSSCIFHAQALVHDPVG